MRAASIPLLLILASCGGAPRCPQAREGIVFLAWTLDGALPTGAACSGVDHLSMTLTIQRCSARIAPVPCAQDKWRYEGLPQGAGEVELEAFDASGRSIAYGSASVTVGPSLPATPTPIAIDRF